MEKIVIVLQGREWAINSIDFACYLAQEGRSRIQGYFLEEPVYEELPRLRRIGGLAYVEPIISADIPEEQSAHAFLQRRMENFVTHCQGKGIVTTASALPADRLGELIQQTKFADLLVVDAAAVPGSQPPDSIPSPTVQYILSAAQCPVFIAPVSQMHPEHVIFCYDGSASAVLAMKQFAYLFPELSGLKATAVCVGDNDQPDAEEVRALTTWMSRHFAFNEFVSLHGKLEDVLYPFVLKHSKAILVMGAYGRGAVSRFFTQSSADYFIGTLSCPIFITHD
ncbi:hypothetical protein WJU16_22840 [Chitinophaga pollutisoli]|uniref:Universal stress protein n=1 Tax=Chitinophaga pollutisoli TaxID=3133966 RepID=A0ABZ2YM19_9BACT